VIPLPLDRPGRSLLLAGFGATGLAAPWLLAGEAAPAVARGGLVVLALAGAVVLLGRRAALAPPARLRVLARAPLARDASAVLVELDGRPMLLGVGRDGVRLLAEPGWTGTEVDP
jgi:hypothetical protein